MCGRYAASASTAELVEQLEIDVDHTGEPVRSVLRAPQDPPAGQADYNIAPSKNARVVLTRAAHPRDGEAPAAVDTAADTADGSAGLTRQLRLLTWGLVPGWAKDPAVGARLTNARSETAATMPAFRAAVRARRALVPADGWYEWQASPSVVDRRGRPRKQPFFIHRQDETPLTFAGLDEFWRDDRLPATDPLAWLVTFAILTTAAEPGLDRIHDRQPLVLDPQEWGAWLDPGSPPEVVAALLAGGRPGRFTALPGGACGG